VCVSNDIIKCDDWPTLCYYYCVLLLMINTILFYDTNIQCLINANANDYCAIPANGQYHCNTATQWLIPAIPANASLATATADQLTCNAWLAQPSYHLLTTLQYQATSLANTCSQYSHATAMYAIQQLQNNEIIIIVIMKIANNV